MKRENNNNGSMSTLDKQRIYYGASEMIIKRAKELRNHCTWEEGILWNYLSDKQLGVKFRRQHPILFYVADFYCHELKLVVEIDGSVHNNPQVKLKDEHRQKEIEALGITVLRFTNNQLKNKPEVIIEKILETIKTLKRK